jgi:hypothetical protein
VVEHPPSKPKALSSSSRTAKYINKQTKTNRNVKISNRMKHPLPIEHTGYRRGKTQSSGRQVNKCYSKWNTEINKHSRASPNDISIV